MKKYTINFLATALLLFIFAGCSPHLARTKYGTTENQWKDYVQKSYKDWEPPPTPPPINNSTVGDDAANNVSIEIVPEPISDNNSTFSGTNDNSVILPEVTSFSPDSKQLASDSVLYTVKKGDTLWSISCEFYNNDGTKWKKIQEANKDVITSPGNIKPGLTLAIPTK